MKRIIIVFLFFALFNACNNRTNEIEETIVSQDNNEQYESNEQEEDMPDPDRVIEGIHWNLGVSLIIVDKELNDRLNPESSAYFGGKFTEGIKVLYLCNGRKLTHSQFYYHQYGVPYSFFHQGESHKTISPPSPNSLNYYSINCSIGNGDGVVNIEDGCKVTYTYISYPDGSEDEIKVQIYQNERGNEILIDKLWINKELVYEIGFSGIKLHYYNPNYHPWMKPYFDDEGNQLGVLSIIPSYRVIIK